MTGFNGVGVTALGPCKMAPWFKFGATLKGFRGRNCLAFSSSPRSLRERVSSILLCNRCMARRRGSDERFCCSRYLSNSWGIFSSIAAWLNPSSPGSMFVLSLQSSWVVVFESIKRYPLGLLTASSYCFRKKPVRPRIHLFGESQNLQLIPRILEQHQVPPLLPPPPPPLWFVGCNWHSDELVFSF